jgi:hypothetical protein
LAEIFGIPSLPVASITDNWNSFQAKKKGGHQQQYTALLTTGTVWQDKM